MYGDGTQTRSFQYVSDLINGMVTVMEGEHIGPFNIGNPGEFTMLELVSSGVGTAVQQLRGWRVPGWWLGDGRSGGAVAEKRAVGYQRRTQG